MKARFAFCTVLLTLPILSLAQPSPPPPLVAPSLPPSPDPSTFTFTGIPPAPSSGDIQLQLALSLFGSDLLPYSNTVGDELSEGLQQTVSGALGADNFRVQDVQYVSEQPPDAGSLEYLFVNVGIVTAARLQQQLLNQLQVTIQNAQLAGQIRVAGLYSLQRLSVSSYSLTAYSAPTPGPIIQPNTPVPSPSLLAPAAATSSAPSPSPALAAGIPEVPAPVPSEYPFPAAPAPSPGTEAPAPAFVSASPFSPAPVPAAFPGEQLPNLEATAAEAPSPATAVGTGAATPSPALPEALAPPAPAPATSPAAFQIVPVMSPALSRVPAPAPGNGQINVTVKLSAATGLNSTGAAALQAVLANLTGQGTSNVQVQGVSPQASPAGRKLLRIEISEPVVPGRRLQQQNSSVPVTISASDYQQVLQNLNSTTNLTSALRQAGLNVTDAQITLVNGQEVINAQMLTAPAPSPSTIIPMPQSSWKNKAILWGVIGGTMGVAILAALLTCMGARFNAARVKRMFPPAGSPAKGKGSSSPTATTSTEDLEDGLQTPRNTSEGQTTVMSTPEQTVEASTHAMVEVPIGDEEEERLLPLPPLTAYHGQFDYVVPSEGVDQPDSNIAEVPEAALTSESEKVAVTRSESEESQHQSEQGSIEPGIDTPDSTGKDESKEVQVQVSSHAVMQLIASGKLFADRFVLNDGCIRGSDAIVVAAKDTKQGDVVCMCKFITSQVEYTKELHLRELFPDNLSPVPGVVQTYPLGSFPRSGIPSAIIFEGGDHSITSWHTQAKPPNAYQKRVIFHMTCKALAKLHRKKIVLGSLTPDNILWFEDEDAIKISSFSFWAFDGTPIPLHPALRFAPPETVQASARRKERMPASFAIDIWSLGAIGFSIFARAPVFGSGFEDLDVIQCLLGNEPLPWELDAGIFEMITNKDARNLVRNMLRKDPSSRWDIEQVLDSTFFSGLPSLPYKPSLGKNPSYPKQAYPRMTMNPLTPLRSSEPSGSGNFSPPLKLQLDTAQASSSQSEERMEDTARVMETPRQKAASPSSPAGSSLPLFSAVSSPGSPSGLLAIGDQAAGPSTLKAEVAIDPQPAAPQTFENAAFLETQFSQPLSDYAAPVNILPRDLLGNPAFSAEAKPLPEAVPPSQLMRSLQTAETALELPETGPSEGPKVQHVEVDFAEAPPRGLAGRPISRGSPLLKQDRDVEEKAEVKEERPRSLPRPRTARLETPRTPGQRRQSGNLTVSTETREQSPSADDASHLPSPVAGIVRSPYAGRPPSARTDSLILKTLSIAGGHSRAGSVAGWESLEGYENAMSEMTSEASNFFNSPFALRPIPASALPNSRGSIVVMGLTIEEVQPQPRGVTNRQILEGIADGSISTTKAPMVPNKGASLEHPVFMMRLGAKFVFRITLMAGSRRGGVPIGLTGPVKMRIGFARSDEGDSLELWETESVFYKWKGMALWDSSSPRVQQLAGKFGQQTRMVVTTDCKRKGAGDILSIEHEIYSVLCTPGQRIPSASTWSRGQEFNNNLKSHQWAHEATQGALTICKVGRQRGAN